MKIKIVLYMLFIILIFLCFCESILAMNTGFSTEDMYPNDQKIFLSNIDVCLLTEEPKKDAITCFDVNNDGSIVVGTKNAREKLALIYTSDGTFKYGYAFDCSGSFGVEWDDNNVLIYFVRSDVAALFDETGNVLELNKIQNTSDNNSYWNNFVYSTERTVNEDQYIMKNNMGLFNIFVPSYSQLIKVDADGNTTTIYDVSSAYKIKIVVIFIAVILFVAIVISGVVRQFIKLKMRSFQSK